MSLFIEKKLFILSIMFLIIIILINKYYWFFYLFVITQTNKQIIAQRGIIKSPDS